MRTAIRVVAFFKSNNAPDGWDNFRQLNIEIDGEHYKVVFTIPEGSSAFDNVKAMVDLLDEKLQEDSYHFRKKYLVGIVMNYVMMEYDKLNVCD